MARTYSGGGRPMAPQIYNGILKKHFHRRVSELFLEDVVCDSLDIVILTLVDGQPAKWFVNQVQMI